MEQTFVSDQKMAENTEKKKTFFDFVKKHKKEIAIVVFVGVFVGVGGVILNNRIATNALNIEEIMAEGLKTHGAEVVVAACHACNLPSNNPINVSEHLRNLPDGWKASQNKIDLAARYGFSLGDHQTWVDSYTKTTS